MYVEYEHHLPGVLNREKLSPGKTEFHHNVLVHAIGAKDRTSSFIHHDHYLATTVTFQSVIPNNTSRKLHL